MRPRIAVIADGDATVITKALASMDYEPVAHANDARLATWLAKERPAAAVIALAAEDADVEGLCDLLEFMHVAHVGSSAATARAVRDYAQLKETVESWHAEAYGDAHWLGYLRVSAALWTQEEANRAVIKEVTRRFDDSPLLVCGAHERLDLCTSPIHSVSGIIAAISDAFVTDDAVLLVEPVEGDRVEVCVLGEDDRAYALPPLEAGADGLAPLALDYVSDSAERDAIRAELERAALEVYGACGLRDAATVHLTWDGASAQVLGCDVVPSIGAGGALDIALEAAGISLAAALDALVGSAIEHG